MSTIRVPDDMRCATIDGDPVLVIAIDADDPPAVWFVNGSGALRCVFADKVRFGWSYDHDLAAWVSEWSTPQEDSNDEFRYSQRLTSSNLFEEEGTQDDDAEGVSGDFPEPD